MKINTLGFWKSVTTWGGSVIAVCGFCYGLSIGKLDLVSSLIAGSGIAINAVGNLIGMAQAKRQKAETAKAEHRLATAESQIREFLD